jgi:hypothetical protein
MAVGVGEKYFLLFSVASQVNVPDAYIMFEVTQFDSYSYLFQKPTFIVLSDTPPVLNIPIKGMRIGVNGAEVPVGQAYVNIDTTIGASGQLLHNVGTVVPLNLGPDGDEFFLTFEVLGTHTNVRTEPAPLTPPPPPDGAPQPDVGVRVFDQINTTMSLITGVSTQQSAVKATYLTVKQQLPTVANIQGFLSAHQVAVAQLAIEYCNALVDDATLRAAFFPGFDFNQPASAAFATPAGRDLILDPLTSRVMNTNVATQPTIAEVKTELNSLMDRLTACGAGCSADRTAIVVKSTCAAALGSGGMLLQ